MSSDSIPRIPQRPHRIGKPIAAEGSPDPESTTPIGVDKAMLSDSDPESPHIPASRPRYPKNRPAAVNAEPGSIMTDLAREVGPRIPSTRPSRVRSDREESSNEESNVSTPTDDYQMGPPKPPAARPLRVRTTSPLPSIPPTGPLKKASTESAIDVTRGPSIPHNRPVRQRTTENLELLVQNTSDQLKEMEQLISKHKDTKDSDKQTKKFLDEPAQHTSPQERSNATRDEDSSSIHEVLTLDNGTVDNGAEEGFKEAQKPGVLENALERQSDQQHSGPPANPESNGDEDLIQSDDVVDIEELKPEGDDQESTEIATDVREHSPERGHETGNRDGRIRESPEAAIAPAYDEVPTEAIPKMPKRPTKTDQSEPPVKDESKNEPHMSDPELKVDETGDAEASLAKKRAPPPVPKKPSSRIAAFQEMLQKNQLEQLQGSRQQQSYGAPKTLGSHNVGRSSPDKKAAFCENLNSLFATPGAPAPAGASKTPTDKASSTSLEKEEKEKSLPDVRQRRAKGPRGRKLPSKVATIEKVRNESTGNDIEVFHLWKTKPRTRIADRKVSPFGTEVIQPPNGYIDSKPHDGIEERRPSVVPNDENPQLSESQVSHNEETLDDLLIDEEQNREKGSSESPAEREETSPFDQNEYKKEVAPGATQSPREEANPDEETKGDFSTPRDYSED